MELRPTILATAPMPISSVPAADYAATMRASSGGFRAAPPHLWSTPADDIHRAIVTGEGPPPVTGLNRASAVLTSHLPTGNVPTRPQGIENALEKIGELIAKMLGRPHEGRG